MTGTRRAAAPLKAALAACAAIILLTAAEAAADPTLSIEARLFGAKTGRFSKNVLAPDPPPLRNVTTGENASNSTFVIVRVATDERLARTARVRLVATGKGRVEGSRRPGFAAGRLLDAAVYLPAGESAEGGRQVGFWLPDTGCLPIALTAELLDPPKRPVSITATLDFRCSE